MPENLQNVRTAAQLTNLPVEHLLCANLIYHSLAVMNPEDPLRPSHIGMIADGAEHLQEVILGPFEDDDEDPQPDEEEEDGFGSPLVNMQDDAPPAVSTNPFSEFLAKLGRK